MQQPTRVALFDLDGTLVDSNYQNALAWFRAFRAVGIVIPVWTIHRHMGMGGDVELAVRPELGGSTTEVRGC